MPSQDSRGTLRIGSRLQRRAERKRLQRQRKLESQARPPDSDPSGSWARMKGTGAPGSGP
jgi:hypothetical protein